MVYFGWRPVFQETKPEEIMTLSPQFYMYQVYITFYVWKCLLDDVIANKLIRLITSFLLNNREEALSEHPQGPQC